MSELPPPDPDATVQPAGIGITITDTNQVIVQFDHGDLPPIQLSEEGARQVGSHIASAADRIDDGFHDSQYTEAAGEDER
jgi:hypothetical protein